MSRFRIAHPFKDNFHAYAGVDHGIFFVEVFREGREASVTSLEFFTDNKPPTLQQCLEFLGDNGFFSEDELHDALVYLQDGSPKPRNMRVVETIMRFKAAVA